MANSPPQENPSIPYIPDIEDDLFTSLPDLFPYYGEFPDIEPDPQPEAAAENPEEPQENVNQPPVEARNEATSSRRVSNRRIASRDPLTMETISSLYHLSEDKAAKEAKWGLANFRKSCIELGIERWPYRKMKSLNSAIEKLHELQESSTRINEETLSNNIILMENAKQELLRYPNMPLDPEVIRVQKRAHEAVNKRKKKKQKIGETSNNEQGNE